MGPAYRRKRRFRLIAWKNKSGGYLFQSKETIPFKYPTPNKLNFIENTDAILEYFDDLKKRQFMNS